MSNKVYDVLKFVAMVVLPATATLYTAIASIWGLPFVEQIPATIVAVDAFLGAILQISAANYKKKENE